MGSVFRAHSQRKIATLVLLRSDIVGLSSGWHVDKGSSGFFHAEDPLSKDSSYFVLLCYLFFMGAMHAETSCLAYFRLLASFRRNTYEARSEDAG